MKPAVLLKLKGLGWTYEAHGLWVDTTLPGLPVFSVSFMLNEKKAQTHFSVQFKN